MNLRLGLGAEQSRVSRRQRFDFIDERIQPRIGHALKRFIHHRFRLVLQHRSKLTDGSIQTIEHLVALSRHPARTKARGLIQRGESEIGNADAWQVAILHAKGEVRIVSAQISQLMLGIQHQQIQRWQRHAREVPRGAVPSAGIVKIDQPTEP